MADDDTPDGPYEHPEHFGDAMAAGTRAHAARLNQRAPYAEWTMDDLRAGHYHLSERANNPHSGLTGLSLRLSRVEADVKHRDELDRYQLVFWAGVIIGLVLLSARRERQAEHALS